MLYILTPQYILVISQGASRISYIPCENQLANTTGIETYKSVN